MNWTNKLTSTTAILVLALGSLIPILLFSVIMFEGVFALISVSDELIWIKSKWYSIPMGVFYAIFVDLAILFHTIRGNVKEATVYAGVGILTVLTVLVDIPVGKGFMGIDDLTDIIAVLLAATVLPITAKLYANEFSKKLNEDREASLESNQIDITKKDVIAKLYQEEIQNIASPLGSEIWHKEEKRIRNQIIKDGYGARSTVEKVCKPIRESLFNN